MEIDSSKISLMKVLPERTEKCFSQVEIFLKENEIRHHKIYSTIPITALFEISQFPNYDDYKNLKVNWFSYVISICVEVPRPAGSLYLLFIDRRENTGYSKNGAVDAPFRKTCSAMGFHLFYGDIDNEEEINEFLINRTFYHADESILTAQLRATKSQLWLLKNIQQAMGLAYDEDQREKFIENLTKIGYEEDYLIELMEYSIENARSNFRVYHEYLLSRLAAPTEKSFLSKGHSYLRPLKNKPADILVASPPPYSRPLLVVEFDGPHHYDFDQAIKDVERDVVLNALGIPVLRVLCETTNPYSKKSRAAKDYNKAKEERAKRDIRASNVFIGYLARTLAREQLRNVKSYLRAIDKILEIKHEVNIKSKSQGVILGNRKEIEEVITKYESIYNEQLLEVDLEEMVDSLEDFDYALHTPKFDPALASLGDFEIIRGSKMLGDIKRNYIQGKANLFTNSGTRPLATPEFFVDLRAKGLDIGIFAIESLYERAVLASINDRAKVLYDALFLKD